MIKNVLISVAIVVTDQLAKCVIRCSPRGFSRELIPGFMRITHCMNSGAAFSFLSGQTALLIVCSLLLMTGILLLVCRKMSLTAAAQSVCASIIGGGISNLLDRLLFGGVTDYLEFTCIDFPVFNIADIAITLSIITLLMMTFTGRLETTGEKHE